jgi:penicillin G amidase
MKIVKRLLFGLAGLLLLVVIGLFIYLQTTKPVYSGELELRGLIQQVEILYDEFGIPHIYAQNEEDAYFALGYVHAQDRLFQMEMLRRAASGRLSEILGPDLIKVDKLFRTLGLNKFAKEHAQKFLSADTVAWQKSALAYQKGINEFIRTGKTPLEFSIIGIPKTEFTPEDIYHAVGFMSFGFAEGLRADPVLQQIKTQWGDAYLKDLAVQTPADAELIPSFDGARKNTQPLIASIHEALRDLPVPLWQGSNGWAISGDRTASGFPILANDTHMGFSQPAVWYEAHLEYPGFSFYGHHVAGIPFALLGNNRRVAWGLTMFENDDSDFYNETLSENGKQVMYKGAWQNLQEREEVIKVKKGTDVVMKIKSSPHGPLINGIIQNVDEETNPVSLWWLIQHEPNRALEAAYRLNHSANLADTEKAASLFSAPGLNVMYADADGNIAWWAVAKLPIRPEHVQSKLFLDGASGKDENLGFYDFSKNPHAVNPPWGFVYSANNQPDTVQGVLYPGYYYPKARAGRIKQLLSQDKKWTVDAVKSVNLDVVSVMHPEIAGEMVAVLNELNKKEYQPFVDALANWDGDHQMENAAPSIYYNLLSQIMKMTMMDELGGTAYESIMATSITKNSYPLLLSNNDSPWWDDVKTKDVKETRAMIFEKACGETMNLLTKIGGENPAGWTWNKYHALTHPHPLAAVKPLDKIFNVGPFEVPGGSEVINNLHFDLDTTGYYPVTGGPALRKVTDFGDVDHGESVSPTGQSGVLMSSHYNDQAEMFATGQTRKMLMKREEIEVKSKKLTLKPNAN